MLSVYMRISLVPFIFTPVLSGKYYTHFTEEETEAQLGLEWILSDVWTPDVCASNWGYEDILPLPLAAQLSNLRF